MIEAQGPMPDPEREARRQQALARLQMVGAGGMAAEIKQHLGGESASGRYRLREYVVLPGQEYFVTGSHREGLARADLPDLEQADNATAQHRTALYRVENGVRRRGSDFGLPG